MTPEEETRAVRARQKAGARITALILGGFVLLVFAIAIVRIQAGMGQ